MAQPVAADTHHTEHMPWVAGLSAPVRKATVGITTCAALLSAAVGGSDLLSDGATQSAALSMVIATMFALMAFMISEH